MDAAANQNETEPLGTGWTIATIAIGVFAALIALGGMILSFRAVSAEMVPAFGAQWAWLVPVVVDLAVLVFSGVDLVLARRAMPHPLARATVYGFTAGTVWLNYGAGGDPVGRAAHVLMPSIWVMFVELMRHVVRHEANLVGTSIRQPIPAARWLLAPYPTAKLFRRMVLWQVHSYPVALAHERERLRKIADWREKHGVLWRFYITPLDRLELNLGPAETVLDAGPAATEKAAAKPQDGERRESQTDRPDADRNGLAHRPKPAKTVPADNSPRPRELDWDVLAEIGRPVYESVKDAVGKRPPEKPFHEALTDAIAKLVAAGELPELYAEPSLSTAKRVRKEVETRFPHLSPLHLIREAS